jgi:hypothetical protein
MSDPTLGMTPEALKRIAEESMRKGTKNKWQQSLPKVGGKKVPFRHVIEFDWHRSFSWKERLQIFFGYSLLVLIRVPTRNNPGELGATVMARTTVYRIASELMKQEAKEALRQEYGDQLPPDAQDKATL